MTNVDPELSCEVLMDRVDSALLDCVGDDIAILLAAAGVDDLRTPLGADWCFHVLHDRPLPRFDLPATDRADRIADRTGLRLVEHPLPSVTGALPAWREHLAARRPVLVVADAFALPWVPYAGHQHLGHGFVVDDIGPDGVLHVVDPYDNVTQWGRARPTTATITAENLEAALVPTDVPCTWAVLLREGVGGPVDLPAHLHRNATGIVAAARDGATERLARAHRGPGPEVVENLTLQAWLAARDRGLHARWLADRAGEDRAGAEAAGATATAFQEHVLPAWARVAETSYVALRRLRAGRAAPTAHLDALDAALDAELGVAAELAARLTSVTTPASGPHLVLDGARS